MRSNSGRTQSGFEALLTYSRGTTRDSRSSIKGNYAFEVWVPSRAASLHYEPERCGLNACSRDICGYHGIFVNKNDLNVSGR